MHMRGFQNGTDTRPTYLYSVHDITLVNLLRTMGFTSEHLKPEYGATLVFEVHAIDDIAEDVEVKVSFSEYIYRMISLLLVSSCH